MINVKIKKFSENAKIPEYAHPESDAGLDIYSAENVLVRAGTRATIKSGIGVQAYWEMDYFRVPDQDGKPIQKYLPLSPEWLSYKIALILKGTSGNGAKNGINILAGVVDQNYTGEIGVVFHNTSDQDIQVNIGDKIAQGVFTLVPKVANIEVVEEFEETDRGENGFGSTGVAGQK